MYYACQRIIFWLNRLYCDCIVCYLNAAFDIPFFILSRCDLDDFHLCPGGRDALLFIEIARIVVDNGGSGYIVGAGIDKSCL